MTVIIFIYTYFHSKFHSLAMSFLWVCQFILNAYSHFCVSIVLRYLDVSCIYVNHNLSRLYFLRFTLNDTEHYYLSFVYLIIMNIVVVSKLCDFVLMNAIARVSLMVKNIVLMTKNFSIYFVNIVCCVNVIIFIHLFIYFILFYFILFYFILF